MSDEDDLDTSCLRCGIDCMPLDTPYGSQDWQYYMVHDDLWELTNIDSNGGMLCIPCLEVAIGRPLSGADFIDAPINYPGFRDDTPYLRNLKMEAIRLKMAV